MDRKFSETVSKVGFQVSTWAADVAAHPFSQIGIIVFCALWWFSGLPTNVLVATLSILAITLTQMVLNRQKLRDKNDRNRDIAMHAKLDELLRSQEHASKELAGIEELEAAELVALTSRLAKSRAAGEDLT
jgi:low affinity Fe/Cu permease